MGWLYLAAAEDRLLWPLDQKLGWVAHIFGLIVWIGGLMYMTRLLSLKASLSEGERKLTIDLARRLHNCAVMPGLIVALVGGLWIAVTHRPEAWHQGWFHAKLFLALVLVVEQAYAIRKAYDMLREPSAGGRGMLAAVHYSIGLLVFAVLLLIRFKPF
jgi:protoporphyrinogen IX oxidase